jgi:hypothetical protein
VNAMQTAVAMVANLLAAGDYASVERMTSGRRLSAADLERAVQEYGETLVPLPSESLEDLEVIEVAGSDPAAFMIDVDLWTEQEGRSDLTLSLQLVDRYSGAYEISVLDLHVQ